jgi:molybdopterin-binding protein
MLQLKLLPGAMLLMLASTLSINPVSAQSQPTTGGMQNPTNTDVQTSPSRLNTQPVPTPMQMDGMQMQQPTPRSMDGMQMQQPTPRSTETTNNMVSGTIRSIEGETVTLEMADGMTKQMMVSKADLLRLNLREGMQVSATLDASSMASNITVAQASTTTTGTEATSSQVGNTSTSTESTTSTTTNQADVSSDTPTTTTTENTRTTVQSTPANRPVRALW